MIIGEFVTLCMMAFALGMDAFSVGVGMGTLRLHERKIIHISLMIGLFHIIMSLGGIGIGNFLSHQFGSIASYIGGTLLLIIGIQMIRSPFRKDEKFVPLSSVGFILFAMTVSLDSFSAGLSLGIYGMQTIIAVGLIGIFSTILTWLGLIIGKHFQQWIGGYSEVLGGSILFTVGLKLLLPV